MLILIILEMSIYGKVCQDPLQSPEKDTAVSRRKVS